MSRRIGAGDKKAWQLPSQESGWDDVEGICESFARVFAAPSQDLRGSVRKGEQVASPIREALVARRHGSYLRRRAVGTM